MTAPHPVVHVDVRVPVAVTEQVFLHLAVQAAVKKYRQLQAESQVLSEPPCTRPSETFQPT